ncbi:MAG: hypothetical protein ACKVTZ_22830 [Bacteroidia bacterium]
MNKLFLLLFLLFSLSSQANTLNRILPADCDIITLLNGLELNGKVVEINPQDVVYYPCDSTDKRVVLIDKREIFSIKYTDGKKEIMHDLLPQTPKSSSTSSNQGPAIEPIGLIGFIISLFFIYAGPVALILGLFSLAKFGQNPEKWRGKGFSWTAVISGAVSTAILLYVILAIML